jgi:hypothetical protein
MTPILAARNIKQRIADRNRAKRILKKDGMNFPPKSCRKSITITIIVHVTGKL